MIQQQVEEIKFEQVYIQKLKHRAHKTNKIRDWLSLLRAYHENNLFDQKDQTIQQMHFKFILNEDFWIEQINRKKTQTALSQKDVQFLFMAIDDGYYQNAAQLVYQILIRQLNKTTDKSTHLRVNYLIAKLQKIISTFKRSKNFYPSIRNYYKSTNNDKKTREFYIREIKQGFDDVDVVYDEYLLWEPKQSQKQQSKPIYEKGKARWQHWNDGGSAQFANISQTNRVQFESTNYLKLLDKLQTDSQKLRHLRIVCLGRHELVNQYFQKMEYLYKQDQQLVIRNYKSLIDIVQQIQVPYLRFLVRRINKHTFSTQDQEYNNRWADNVQYFRQQITYLLSKPRLTPKTEQSIKQSYYNYWVDVQTSLVKDKQIVCQIFQALLQLKQSVEHFTKYSNCMVRLGYYADAKHILKRSCTAFKYDYQAYKQYQNFISIYGTIDDSIQFRKLKMLQKSQMEEQKSNGKVHTQQNNHHQVRQNTAESKKSIQNIDKMDEQYDLRAYKQKQLQNSNVNKLKEIKKFRTQIQRPYQKSQQIIVRNIILKSPQKQTKVNQKESQVQIDKEQNQVKKKMHTDSGNTLYIKGFPTQWKKQQITKIIKNKQKVKQIRLIQKKGVPQNYCYIEMETQEDAAKQVIENQHKNLYYIAISRPPSSFNESKTLFLAGLPSTANIEKIKSLFPQNTQDIQDVRIKMDQNKHIAYVDFPTSEIKNKMLQKYSNSNFMIDNKKIIIQQSNSKPAQLKKENRVIILKQLSFKAKQKDIVQFFKDYSVQDVYIPEGQNGKSKGFAFVKFKSISQFHEALSKQKGNIKGRTFQIHKSDRDIQRPKKQQKQKQKKQQKSDSKVNNDYFSNLFK